MRRLRESWVALGGATLIVALSISSAFGANAPFSPGAIGQQIAEFVRDATPVDRTEALDAGDDELDTTEDTAGAHEPNDTPQPGDEGYEWANHGDCVSWHAHQDESAEGEVDENGDPWANHGAYVSYWARTGCAEEMAADETTDVEEDEAADEAADETLNPGEEGYEWANHGECVSWHAHEDESADGEADEDGNPWKNHGAYVSHWARVGCAEEMADDESAADSEGENGGDEADKKEQREKKEKRDKGGNGHGGNGRGNGRGG